MGIINITPDSFYAESRCNTISSILEKVDEMQNEGVSIIDLGAMSSKPGAQIIDKEEELKRLLPVLKEVVKNFPNLFISIDTIHASIAQNAIEIGAHIINDISGGHYDPEMLKTIGEFKIPFVCMHSNIKETDIHYSSNNDNILITLLDYFIERKNACSEAGIKDLILDPGFGFGKNLNDNYNTLKNLNVFQILELPILVGISRKSMIYKPLNTTPEESLSATTALHLIALQNGANILRVHDVKEANEAFNLYNLLYK